jgi:hypothetical protein
MKPFHWSERPKLTSGSASFLAWKAKGSKAEKKTPNAQHPTPNVKFRKSVLIFD